MADRLEMDFCLIIGENELRSGQYTLKDLANQVQKKISKDQIVQVLREHYFGVIPAQAGIQASST